MSQSMWWMLVIGAIAVFTVFHIKVFSKMVGKHANRIAGYVEDKIAFFYMGLGIALALSGMSFLGRFVRRGICLFPALPSSAPSLAIKPSIWNLLNARSV